MIFNCHQMQIGKLEITILPAYMQSMKLIINRNRHQSITININSSIDTDNQWTIKNQWLTVNISLVINWQIDRRLWLLIGYWLASTVHNRYQLDNCDRLISIYQLVFRPMIFIEWGGWENYCTYKKNT